MTIVYKPNDYTAVMENILVTCYDAHAITDNNYKYVAALSYHNGTTWVHIVSQQTRPIPNNGHGIFDFGTQCRNVFNSKLKVINNNNNLFSYGINELYGRFKVDVREVYNGATSAVLVSGEFYLFNSYNLNYFNTSFDQMRLIYDGKKYGYLSNRDLSNFKISSRSKYFLMPILNFTNATQSIAINYLSYNLNINLTSNNAHHLNIATQRLAIDGFIFDTQNPQVMSFENETDSDYNFANINYELVCDNQNNHYCLHFLNSFGVYESVLFSKPSKKDIKIERKNYEKKEYDVQVNGTISLYEDTSSIARLKNSVNYNTTYTEVINLKSDLLTDKDYKWLKELVVSPSIYVTINDSEVFIPCSIKQSNYEEKTYITNKLSQFDLQIESQKNFRVI